MPKLEARMAPLHIMAVQEAVLIMMTKMISLQQITMMKMKMMIRMMTRAITVKKTSKMPINYKLILASNCLYHFMLFFQKGLKEFAIFEQNIRYFFRKVSKQKKELK